MHKLPIVKPGDSIEIIAPASRCSDKELMALKNLLISWQLNCIVKQDIFGDDLLCANSDEARFNSLKNALQNLETKAVICARGGYGCMRLIPGLNKINPPSQPKLFVGMSDITAINLYLQQQWQWPTLHGSLSLEKFSPQSIAALKSVLFADVDQVEFLGYPLNYLAEKNNSIESTITGGNLCIVQASIGTMWQIVGRNKIILLEEIGERAYRVDRMLEHLFQANVFKGAAAILFGDFLAGKETNESSTIQQVLERFAKNCPIPVAKVAGIGHGYTNFPMPLGTKVILKSGNEIKVTCCR